MSSPFPIPTLASSPFPFPLPQIAQPGQQQQQHVSPQHAGVAGLGVSFAPSPLSQLMGSTLAAATSVPNVNGNANNNNAGSNSHTINSLGLGTSTSISTGLTPIPTPAAGGLPFGVSPSYLTQQTQGVTPNTSAMLAAAGVSIPSTIGHAMGLGGASGLAGAGAGPGPGAASGIGIGMGGKDIPVPADGVQGLIHALEQGEALIARAEGLLAEIKQVQGRVFGDVMDGDADRLMALHTEYAQTLQTINTLSQTYLIGALPSLPPSSDMNPDNLPSGESAPEPAQAQGPSVPAPAPAQGPDRAAGPQYTDLGLADLVRWAEERAALEFARREALKASGKAVLDILRLSSGGAAAGSGAGVGVGVGVGGGAGATR